MRRNRSIPKAVAGLAASLASLAIVTGTASAMVRDDAASRPSAEQALLRAGLVGPDGSTDVLRPSRYEGVARPDGYVPNRGGVDPLLSRGGSPDGLVSPTPTQPISVSATSDGFDREGIAIGFGLGLALAMGCVAIAARGRRTRVAHT